MLKKQNMDTIFQQLHPKDGQWHLIELEGISSFRFSMIKKNHSQEFFTNHYSLDLNKFIDKLRQNHYKIINVNTQVVPVGLNINRVHYCMEIRYE